MIKLGVPWVEQPLARDTGLGYIANQLHFLALGGCLNTLSTLLVKNWLHTTVTRYFVMCTKKRLDLSVSYLTTLLMKVWKYWCTCYSTFDILFQYSTWIIANVYNNNHKHFLAYYFRIACYGLKCIDMKSRHYCHWCTHHTQACIYT